MIVTAVRAPFGYSDLKNISWSKYFALFQTPDMTIVLICQAEE